MATNATYKIWNGSTWVEYHFKTNADQVNQTTGTGWKKFVSAKVKVNGVSFAEGSETGSAQVTINGSHISWFNGTKPNTNYLGNASDVQAALQALDTAAKSAYDRVPTGSVTYGGGGAFGTLFPDLLAIEGLSGTSGLLKKTAANTWALDTTSYVPTSRTVNGKQLNNNITLKASDIGWNNAAGFVSNDVEDEIQNLWIAAKGITRGYGIDTATSGTNVVNNQFATNAGERSFTITDSIPGGVSTKKIRLLNSTEEVLLSSLKVGDNIFLTDTEKPDWWVSGFNLNLMNGSLTVTFSILETQSVNLSNYATKGTTLAHYGITDAKINGNTITLGSNSITVITDISGKAPNNHASSATTYGVGTGTNYGHVKLATGDMKNASHEDGVACSKNHTHSQYLTSHQSLNEYPKIFVQNAQPTASKTGDLWIQIPQA